MATPSPPSVPSAYQCAVLIKSLRTFFRLSQNDLAKLSRVSRPTIDRIESLRGLERARQETLEQLMDTFRFLGLGITLDPEKGATVTFDLMAMALSIEHLTEDPELRCRLTLFARPAADSPSMFERVLALSATQGAPLVERYRQAPWPEQDDPAWQVALGDAHALQAPNAGVRARD